MTYAPMFVGYLTSLTSSHQLHGWKIHQPDTRPGKRLQKNMERSTIFHRKTHEINGHFQ